MVEEPLGGCDSVTACSPVPALPAVRRSGREVVLLAALAAATTGNVLVVLLTPYFPFGDTANHLARYSLISSFWAGRAPAWVQFRMLPTGYIAVDLVGAMLVKAMGPRAAMHALAAAYAVLLPGAMYSLLRAVNRHNTVWALVGCLLTFNWYFVTGFLSYSLGVPMALLWLAWWWPRRGDARVCTVVTGMLGIAALYLVHMAAAATALVGVLVGVIEPLLGSRGSWSTRWRRVLPRSALAAAYALPAAALNALMRWSTIFPPASDDRPIFRGPTDKLKHLVTPFATFSVWQTLFLLGAYTIAVVLYIRRDHPGGAGWSKWVVTVVMLLLAYAVFPVFALNAWDVDVRFLLPAFLVIFVNPPTVVRGGGTRTITVTLLMLSLMHASITAYYSKKISDQTQTIVSLLNRIPPNSNVLFLAPRNGAFYRAGAFMHTGEWLTIDQPQRRVNGLFAGGTNGAYLDHFTETSWVYDPGTFDDTEGIPRLRWDRVRQDYGYIVFVGSDTAANYARIRKGAMLVRRAPGVALFAVTE